MSPILTAALIIATTVLALFYGLFWHNQPANERNLARDHDDHPQGRAVGIMNPRLHAYLDGEFSSSEAIVTRQSLECENEARSFFEGLHVALLVVALFTSGCAHYRGSASLAAVEPRTGSTSQEQEIDPFATGQGAIF